MTKDYRLPKLVRDGIPGVIAGCTPVTHTVEGEELRQALIAKLGEESDEVSETSGRNDRAEVVKELADVVEVVYAIARNYGYLPEDVENIRYHKKTQRGGFSKGIILDRVV